MATQDKLVKIGKEGFALLDEAYGRSKKPARSRVPTATTTQAYDHYHHQYYNNQLHYVYRGPQVITVLEPVIDSNQAAQFYGGMSVVDHGMRKPIPGA